MKSCCEFHDVDCVQGRRCPVNAFYAETEPVFPCVTGCSTKALPLPMRQPLPVIDNDPRPLSLIFGGIAAVGITFIAFWAARAIVIFAPG